MEIPSRVTARFTGESSMGFKTGRIYTLRLGWRIIKKRIGGPVFGHWDIMCCLCAYDVGSSQRWCPYSSYETFLNNWDVLDRSQSSIQSSPMSGYPNYEKRKDDTMMLNGRSYCEPVNIGISVNIEVRAIKHVSGVNVRNSPGFDGEVTGHIKSSNGWFKGPRMYTKNHGNKQEKWVYVDGMSGWVNMAYVKQRNRKPLKG